MNKDWFNQQFIYHILVDRFTGDSTLPNMNTFLGGTIKGIISHLDYICSLGANTIWLSPVFETKNYHGYHITDFYKVDPHFGTLEDLCQLIELVHCRGMHIISDFVPNHCADTHPYFVDALNHTDSSYRNWFYFNKDNTYKCFMNFDELPKLNLDERVTRRYMLDVTHYWLNLGFDGLRIDHAVGPSFSFWREFMAEMNRSFPDKVFFGEVWCAGLNSSLFNTVHLKKQWNKAHFGISQEELQQDYIGELDGVLDFEYRNIIVSCIERGERIKGNRNLLWRVKRHFRRYPKDFKLVLFLDNHDTDRILYSCRGDLSLLQEAIDFTRSLKRPFAMYYGTELGMTNTETVFSGKPYADLAARECVEWDKAKVVLKL